MSRHPMHEGDLPNDRTVGPVPDPSPDLAKRRKEIAAPGLDGPSVMVDHSHGVASALAGTGFHVVSKRPKVLRGVPSAELRAAASAPAANDLAAVVRRAHDRLVAEGVDPAAIALEVDDHILDVLTVRGRRKRRSERRRIVVVTDRRTGRVVETSPVAPPAPRRP